MLWILKAFMNAYGFKNIKIAIPHNAFFQYSMQAKILKISKIYIQEDI